MILFVCIDGSTILLIYLYPGAVLLYVIVLGGQRIIPGTSEIAALIFLLTDEVIHFSEFWLTYRANRLPFCAIFDNYSDY